MKKMSSSLVLIGALTFLIGAALVLGALRGGDDDTTVLDETSELASTAETVEAQKPVPLRAAAIEIPVGKQGVALQVPFVAGGAGYVGVGDFVNVYGNAAPSVDESPVTKLVLSNVEVLDVSTEVAPRVTGETERPVGSAVTYLLALDADQAERVIYLASNAEVWLALSGDPSVPQPATAGRRAGDVLQ